VVRGHAVSRVGRLPIFRTFTLVVQLSCTGFGPTKESHDGQFTLLHGLPVRRHRADQRQHRTLSICRTKLGLETICDRVLWTNEGRHASRPLPRLVVPFRMGCRDCAEVSCVAIPALRDAGVFYQTAQPYCLF